jgi:hypothetical protein
MVPFDVNGEWQTITALGGPPDCVDYEANDLLHASSALPRIPPVREGGVARIARMLNVLPSYLSFIAVPHMTDAESEV